MHQKRLRAVTSCMYTDRFRRRRDAFSKREQADENLYVRQKEQEKLQELKKKIMDHKKHLDELDQHVYVHENGEG